MIDSFISSIVKAIQKVVGSAPAPLHEPSFQDREWEYVKECLDSTYVSSVGQFVDRFEAELAYYTGAKHAIAVVNGTAALHTALCLAGVQMGDEVLIPALTFVATANAVSYCGAIPHLVESERKTLGVDPIALREHLKSIAEVTDCYCINRQTGRRIRALVPMHTFGHPADLEGLMSVARDFRLAMVEDAAESLGSWYGGQHTGTIGQMGAISFNGNKIITTGGGGAILTNDSDLAKQAKHLTTTAKLPHSREFIHDRIGYNYRMPNLNAALGCAQLEQLPEFVKAKRQLFKQYQTSFKDIADVQIISEPENCRSNYWLQAIMLEHSVADQRDDILEVTNQAGLMTRPVWRLMHQLNPYKNSPRMELPVAESLAKKLINIPSSAGLTQEKTIPTIQEVL